MPGNLDKASLEERMEEQAGLIRSISNTVTNLRKKGKAALTEATLKGRLEDLKEYWTRCRAVDALLCAQFDAELRKKTPYFANELFTRTEEAYEDAVDFIRNLLRPEDASSPTSAPQPIGQVKRPCVTNPPPLPVPRFSGSILEWAAFRDLFTSVIRDNANLSDAERLQYLLLSLSGEAARVLHHISVSEGNFNDAWQTLVEEFDDSRGLVNAHLNVIFDILPIKSDFLANLKAMRDKLRTSLNAIAALNRPTEKWDDWVICFLSRRLDKTSRTEWENFVGGLAARAFPTLDQFKTFLKNRVRTLEILAFREPTVTPESVKRNTPVKKSAFHASNIKSNARRQCHFCKGDHLIYACTSFASLSVNERIDFVNTAKLCRNCLSPGHSVSACKSRFKCSACGKLHHKMLHPPNAAGDKVEGGSEFTTCIAPKMPSTSSYAPPTLNFNSVLTANESSCTSTTSLLATARVAICNGNRRSINARALLDQASESTFVTEDVVRALQLSTQRASVSVCGLSGTSSCTAKFLAIFSIRPLGRDQPVIPVQALVIKSISSYVPRTLTKGACPREFQDLALADPSPSQSDSIDLLIGSDLYAAVFQEGIRRTSDRSLLAQSTIFGWVITGSVPTSTPYLRTLSLHVRLADLKDDLQRFWELEQIPEASRFSDEDKLAEQHFKLTHRRDTAGRFSVRLPFSRPPFLLGSSYRIAQSSFTRLENRFSRDSHLEALYSQFMQEYEELKHMVPGSAEDVTKPGVFLPHHPVWRLDRSPATVRVVFNASSPSASGLSLNDCLMTGPKLQQDLSAILLRWRSYRYVMTADIVKMFRQIMVDPRDQRYQQILWRARPTDPVLAYKLTTVTYGIASAPFLALRVLHQLVEDEGKRFPLAAPFLAQNTYVDDVLFGADDVPLLQQIQEQLIGLLGSACLPLSKWTSNCNAMLTSQSSTPPAEFLIFSDQAAPGLKVLGLYWHPMTDSFRFEVETPSTPLPTKRLVLSAISRLFDPLGWIAPITVAAKMFIQSLWAEKLTWDQPLPRNLAQRWSTFMAELALVSELRIPRWSGQDLTTSNFELHGFSDASERAYAAAIYLRVHYSSGATQCCLLTAKSKVAPLKTVSIPRLELCGALLAARLLRFTQDVLALPSVPSTCWSDSRIVLAWLDKAPSHWQTFVANRVSSITSTIPDTPWRYVPTKTNPADLASRGIPPGDLVKSDLWWRGPPWLVLPREEWPIVGESSHTSLEAKPPRSHSHVINPEPEWDLIHRYSCWPRLLRVTARILQASRSFRPPSKGAIPSQSGHALSSQELLEASRFWVRHLQRCAFANEIRCLTVARPLPNRSPILALDPFLDDQGLLRLGGRLRHSHLPSPAKHPLILPKHRLTELIVDQAHLRTLHGGLQLTLHVLRQQYWVVGARSLVKSRIHLCVRCIRERARSADQKMGDLPSPRCTPARPFSRCGIDYAGPMAVSATKGRGHKTVKSWVALFVCLSTRAIHLELVTSYDTRSFLAAFDRFSSRRGVPSDVYSDNGTNFVGADRELQRLFRNLSADAEVTSQFAFKGLGWHFNPPAAPHFGGIWEAGVRSVKHHLRRVLGHDTPSIEEFSTLLCRIEACLNSRPLAPLRDDPESVDALTPGHFLIGDALLSVPAESCLDTCDTRLSRWQLWQKRLQCFWRKWRSDYLNSLQLRSKWRSVEANIQRDDLVILKNANLPPSKWELGRVIECNPGADGLVRVLKLKTATSVFTRPITQVVPLPIPRSP